MAAPFLASVVVRYVFPTSLIASFVAVLAFSDLSPNLLFVDGSVARWAMVVYIPVLLGNMVFSNNAPLHAVGGVLAAFAILGRAGGFFELVLASGRLDLLGATLERIALFTAVVMWHRYLSWRIGLAESWGESLPL